MESVAGFRCHDGPAIMAYLRPSAKLGNSYDEWAVQIAHRTSRICCRMPQSTGAARIAAIHRTSPVRLRAFIAVVRPHYSAAP